MEMMTLTILSWVAYRVERVEKDVQKINALLGVPVDILLKEVQNGQVKLSTPEKDSPTLSNRTEGQDL